MIRVWEGQGSGENLKIGIIVARWNPSVTESLLKGAIDTLRLQGVKDEAIDIVKVPGCFEVPWAAQMLVEKQPFDAIICLGAVIKGETSHHLYIAQEVSRGIHEVARDFGIPIGFGILTTDTFEQALARAGEKIGGKGGNKGSEAAAAAVEMALLYQRWTSEAE